MKHFEFDICEEQLTFPLKYAELLYALWPSFKECYINFNKYSEDKISDFIFSKKHLKPLYGIVLLQSLSHIFIIHCILIIPPPTA